MREENRNPPYLVGLMAISLVLAGVALFLWMMTDDKDDSVGVKEPQGDAAGYGTSKPEEERFALALGHVDVLSEGGKLRDVCEGTFRWLGGGEPMCLVLHDVGSTRYEVHEMDDRAWLAMNFFYRDRAARNIAFNDIWEDVRERDSKATHGGKRFDFTHHGRDGFCDLTLGGHTDVFCKVRFR